MSGADCFAVANYAEAGRLALRSDKPVIILGAPENAAVPRGAVPTVSGAEEIELLRTNGWRGKVHIKVDSGMHRLGCRPETVGLIADRAAAAGMTVDGVFTHFHCADDVGITSAQFARFDDATRGLGLKRHCCASNALFLPEKWRLDMIRPGLALYGYGADGLIPAMKVSSRIVSLKFVRKGEYIGYGSFRADKDMLAAVVSGGYADGFRRVKGRRFVSVGGRKCPLVGQVCMDMFFVDVTDILCHVGDEVVLLGDGNRLAESYGTIVYEALTGFGCARGRRVYAD